MTERIDTSEAGSRELLSAYFDGELDGSEREQVERAVETDPALKTQLAQLSFMRSAVVSSLENEAHAVPSARFEQVWDEIERSLDREVRLQEAADREASIWTRLAAWLRPVRLPLAVAGAAAVVAILVVRPTGQSEQDPSELATNKTKQLPSEHKAAVTKPSSPQRPDTASTMPENHKIAAADAEDDLPPFPEAATNDADIQRIDFGGKSGRVSQTEGKRGTTTVIWVTEEEPVDSERPL